VLPFNDKTLDLVILSHPNKDHYNGLFDLLEQYHVRAVLLNNLTYPSSTFQKLIEELKRKEYLSLGERQELILAGKLLIA